MLPVWPPTDPDPARAAAHLSTLVAWTSEHGLPELPDEHRGLADHPLGLRLRVGHLPGAPWSEVFLSQHTAAGLGTWVTWTTPTGDAGQAFWPPGVSWALSPVLNGLLRGLPGDAIAVCAAASGRQPLLPRGTWVHPDGWWDAWKHRQTDGAGAGLTLGEVYGRWLHPRVLAVVAQLVDAGVLGADGAPLRVIDVCGGDGELAAALCARHDAVVTLIERNVAGAEAARGRLGAPHRVIAADAVDVAAWTSPPADLCLLAGAIQGNVMAPADAAVVARHVFAALRPGGIAVVTGWSPCLLDPGDFAALGFEVGNTAVPPSDEDPNPRQLVVLRRPA